MKQLLKPTLLKMIEGSVGTKMFRNNLFEEEGKEVDILKNGNLSCAFYVSSIFYLLKMIGGVHATVAGTVSDLLASDWKIVSNPEAGDVIIWVADETGHKHIGFCVGEGKSISNDSKLGYPTEHHWTF